jgi:hypothetical protein
MRALVLCAAAVAIVALVGTGGAATHSPCTYHGAGAPYIVYVTESNQVVLYASGGIGGCPLVTTVAASSASVKVCAQHRKADSSWSSVACASASRSWNRYSRFARQIGATARAVCSPGVWRTTVTGGDGFAPFRWSSPTVRFASKDGYPCGEPGGA